MFRVRVSLSLAIILSFSTLCGVGSYLLYNKWKLRRPPKKWRKVGIVTKLYNYPLKSGRYVELEEVECTKFGFVHGDKFKLKDRSFIIYGESNLVGKSAKIYPKMVSIAVKEIDETHVLLEAPEMENLTVEVPEKSNENVKINFIKFQDWSKENLKTLDCGDTASKWISKFLIQKDSGLCLGYHDIDWSRNIKDLEESELKFYKHMTNSSFGLFADFSSLLLLNEKTLVDLNEKADAKITALHFRPNIVVDGPELEPFVEDDWFWIKIGNEVVGRNVRECIRCVLTTIDPETGIRDMGREPLKTLSKYRISRGPAKGPIMGLHLDVVSPGMIRLNDEVHVGIVE